MLKTHVIRLTRRLIRFGSKPLLPLALAYRFARDVPGLAGFEGSALGRTMPGNLAHAALCGVSIISWRSSAPSLETLRLSEKP